MTIEEKAKEFAGYKNSGSKENVLTYASGTLSYDGFKAGAEWMIDKAIEWFKNQEEETGIPWLDDYEVRFRKAMEE